MQAYEAVRRQYGFELPDAYRTLQGGGHFDVPPTDNYLTFYDCEWLPLCEIADYEFNKWEIASDGGFVPFAITGRHEPYCWRLDWTSGGEPPIVLCERCESGLCLAPDFRGFLYRMTLEALPGAMTSLATPRLRTCAAPWTSSPRSFPPLGPDSC